MLWLYRRVIFGELTKDSLKNILDLNRREVAVFAPLVATVLWMGIYPSSFFAVMEPSVGQLIKQYDNVRAAAIEDGTLSPDGPFALLSWNTE